MFCLFAYIFKILLFQSCDITFRFVRTDFQDIKEWRKTTSKRMKGIFRMDVVRPILFSFVFPCLVENIWRGGWGLSRRALFWASEAKRRVRWLAAVKTLYHWSTGEIPGAATRHVSSSPRKKCIIQVKFSGNPQKGTKAHQFYAKPKRASFRAGWMSQNKRQENEPVISCLPPMIIS